MFVCLADVVVVVFIPFPLRSFHSLCFIRLSATVAVSLRRCHLLLLLLLSPSSSSSFFSSFPLEFLYVSFYFELYFLLGLRCFCATFSYNNTLSICRLSVGRAQCFAVFVCTSVHSIQNPDAGLLPHILYFFVSLTRSFACSLSLGNVCVCVFFFHSIRRFSFHYTTMTA